MSEATEVEEKKDETKPADQGDGGGNTETPAEPAPENPKDE